MLIEQDKKPFSKIFSLELEGIITDEEYLKAYILQDRLKITLEETIKLLHYLKIRIAKILNTIPQALELDFQFKGKNINIIISIDKQNLDPK